MIVKLSRLLLVAVTIVILAVAVPRYYWMALEKPEYTPFVTYSSISHKIIIGKRSGLDYIYYDSAGKHYTHEQVDSLTPLSNYTQLAAKEMMPEQIDDRPISLEDVRKNRLFIRYRPYQPDVNLIQLYPLFESNPPRLKLKLPEHFFRLQSDMEVINARTNQVDEAITNRFSVALQELGFQYPAKKVFSNPTTRKPYDAGYFITDQKGHFYHIKMVDGSPVCKRVPLPDGMTIKYMIVYEHVIREFYGLIISGDNDLLLLMTDGYRLQKLPIENFLPEKQQILLRGNLFYRIINLISPGSERTVVLDRDYHKVDEHELNWSLNEDSWAGVLSDYLFPFTLRLSRPESYKINIYSNQLNWYCLYLGFVLAGLLYLFRGTRKRKVHPWYDYLITFVFGLYGLIAIIIFKDLD